MTLSNGTSLGPYEIISSIGAGGMGEVYRAKDTRLDREVAVKVLPDTFARDPDRVARFEREAKAVAAISHPNILAIYDVGTVPPASPLTKGGKRGVSYVVTELLEGETLRDRIRRSPVPWRKAVEIGASICDGIAAAHAKSIIHRDLKPDNIFLTKDGMVKILDFGLARIGPQQSEGYTDNTPTMTIDTKPGTVMGTVSYMSPEQVRGQKIDARSDIFSLGCVLYEMVTGRRAFQADTSVETMTAILREDPPSVTSSLSGIGPDLDRVINRCLEKRPEQRFHAAPDLAFTLRELLSDSVTTQVPMLTPAVRISKWVINAGIAAVLIVATLLISRELQEPKNILAVPIQSLAVLPLENISGDPDQEFFANGMTDAIITNLTKISALRVTAPTSVMRFKGSDTPLPEIARALNNVGAIVTGTILRSGNRVRITARLTDIASDRLIWSNSYERNMQNILAMQSEVAREIAKEIGVQLSPAEQAELVQTKTVIPDAYEAYMRGMELVRRGKRETCHTALIFFDQAIRIDPDFALAYAGKAEAYQRLSSTHIHPKDTMPQMKKAAEKALELDENLPEAHIAMGHYLMQYEWDWEGGKREFTQAIANNKNSTEARIAYAGYLAIMKHPDEALKQLDMIREWDPTAHVTNDDYGMVLYSAKQYPRAIRDGLDAIKIDPDFWPAYQTVGLAQSQLKQHTDAVYHMQRAFRLSESPQVEAMLGGVLAIAGHREEARLIRKKLKENHHIKYVCPYEVATISIGLQEYDQAFEEMDQACEDRAACIPFLPVDPRLDPIRDDPRFDRMLERVGFEPPRRQLMVDKAFSNLQSSKIMLAVLPFKNLGPAEDEYFADGISDEIRSRLAAVRKLGVISRSSAFQYKNTDKSNKQIGSELGVDYLIDGTIRWDKRGGGAGRVRITPELIRISDDISLWSQPYNRVLEDIFEVQSDIAGQVIKQLKITLLEPERQAIEVIPTENTDAYQAYLRGLNYMERPDYLKENYLLAIQMFERAVSFDPSFALAYTQLSIAHSAMHHFGHDATEVRAAKAKAAVERALELQPDLPEAHLSLGHYHYWCHRDYGRALEALAIAEKDLPNDSRILVVVGYIWRRQGRLDEALDNLKRAFELTPLNATLANEIAETYILLRRYSDAERWCDRSISLAPD